MVRIASLAVACMVLIPATVFAGNGRNQNSRRGNTARVYGTANRSISNPRILNQRRVQYPSRSQYPGRNQGGIWSGPRNGVYYPQNGRPPGWSQGQKNGWGNCNLPPGQAKKQGCVSGYGGYGNWPYGGMNRQNSGWHQDRNDRYDRDRRWNDRDRGWRDRDWNDRNRRR